MNTGNPSEGSTALPQNPDVQTQGQPLEVAVVGALWHVQFPEMCLKCGQRPSRTLPIHKLFYRTGTESSSRYLLGRVDAPFCASCLQAQAREQKRVAASDRQRLLRKWFWEVLPFFFPFGGALWFLTKVIPLFVTTLAHHKHPWEVLFMAGLCAFFGLIALSFYHMTRERGRQLILEPNDGQNAHYVRVEPGPLGSCFIVAAEPTSVQRALDFTDDVSALFDAERHLYTFENADVARRFAELNADRTWNPNARQAKRASTGRALVIAAVVLYFLYELLKGLLGRG